MKNRATAVLRLIGVLLILAISSQLSLSRTAHATTPSCTSHSFCSPCVDGGAQRCIYLICNGVTGNPVCDKSCIKDCTP
jgi:hypothetical protein